MAAAIWNALLANHILPGTTGEAMTTVLSVVETPKRTHYCRFIPSKHACEEDT